MQMKIAAAVVLSVAFAAHQRGYVSSVTGAVNANTGAVQFTVRGNNPCGAVSLDYGDGTQAVTHAISRLPVTLNYEYNRTGQFQVRARGMGNCDGDVFTNVNIGRVRSGGGLFGNRRDILFPEMDANGDGVITRAEWQGNAQSFDDYDWNNDGRLSGNEIRTGAIRFGGMDTNRDGTISRAEWRGNDRSFDEHDWNDDGVLSGEEVRPGAQPPEQWTEAEFRRSDRNRDNYLSGNEWSYGAADFTRVDRDADNRISLNEFLAGRIIEMPGGRGRGRGRGNEPALLIMVSGRTAWTDTGVSVRAGQLLDIDATGTVRFSGRSEDIANPNGAGHLATARAPLPKLAIGALIGRVGNSAPFFVGENRTGLRAPASGRLYLGINDDNLGDNSGSFQANVVVGRR